jgi:hypothetical protein
MNDLNAYFASSAITLVAAAIDKKAHGRKYAFPSNPYSLSLAFCLERIYACLEERGEIGKTMFCIFEERGAAEDRELAHEFEKICSGENQWGKLPFRMVFANKQQNMPGLQVADLAAYPIAKHAIDRTKPNPASMVLRPNFRHNDSRMRTQKAKGPRFSSKPSADRDSPNPFDWRILAGWPFVKKNYLNFSRLAVLFA